MDTRRKILSGEAAIQIARQARVESRKLTVVTGYFDVLQAAQIRHLTEVRKGAGDGILIIVLLPRTESLLPLQARAELLAGLNMIDYVVIGGEEDALLERLAADEVIPRQADDDEQTRLLMEHVLVRHNK
jgi:bifunctional ADP-heptose synthase (sugar kinase/adenylyltransferase)